MIWHRACWLCSACNRLACHKVELRQCIQPLHDEGCTLLLRTAYMSAERPFKSQRSTPNLMRQKAESRRQLTRWGKRENNTFIVSISIIIFINNMISWLLSLTANKVWRNFTVIGPHLFGNLYQNSSRALHLYVLWKSVCVHVPTHNNEHRSVACRIAYIIARLRSIIGSWPVAHAEWNGWRLCESLNAHRLVERELSISK